MTSVIELYKLLSNLKIIIMSEYKILKVIGKGAFGDAYLGLHLKERKEYVIKQVDVKNKSLE